MRTKRLVKPTEGVVPSNPANTHRHTCAPLTRSRPPCHNNPPRAVTPVQSTRIRAQTLRATRNRAERRTRGWGIRITERHSPPVLLTP